MGAVKFIFFQVAFVWESLRKTDNGLETEQESDRNCPKFRCLIADSLIPWTSSELRNRYGNPGDQRFPMLHSETLTAQQINGFLYYICKLKRPTQYRLR